jgi:peptidyl-prolyl cis-trans isomerase B (cyclophilin B)
VTTPPPLLKWNWGRIVIEFYPQDAPNHVDNFITLAKKGFYDGLKFHRVIAKFVAQGGDPEGTGRGGPGYKIKAEFNSKKHLKGTVAMARSQDPDSAGSQFYICLEPQPGLDGQYTVFGQVVEGMDIVEGIKVGDIMKKVTIVDKETIKKDK